MMKLKNLRAALAAGLLGAALLTGCAAQTQGAADEPADDQSTPAETSTAPASNAGSAGSAVSGWAVETYDSEFPVGDYVALDEVLFDENGLKVTATGFGPAMYYAALGIQIENATDQAMSVWAENGAINGWSWNTSLVTGLDEGVWNEDNGIEIAPGEAVSCAIGFSDSYNLSRCNIQAIAQVGFSLAAFAVDSADTIAITPELIVDIPGTEGYTQTYDVSGNVTYDEGGIKVIACDIADTGWGTWDLPLYIENGTGQDFVVIQTSRTIDGVTTDEEFPAEIASVPAGMHAFASPWAEEELTQDSSYQFALRLVAVDPATHDEIEELASFTASNA